MNGGVEEIRNSTHNKMTHARAMWDECEPELLSALEPMQCAIINKDRQSRDADN